MADMRKLKRLEKKVIKYSDTEDNDRVVFVLNRIFEDDTHMIIYNGITYKGLTDLERDSILESMNIQKTINLSV